jgi:hypothetical protein
MKNNCYETHLPICSKNTYDHQVYFTYKTSPKPLALELNAQWKLPTAEI